MQTKHPNTTNTKQYLALCRNPLIFCAFGFGSGLLPKAPGTWGSVLAAILYLGLSLLSTPWYIIMLCITFAFGIWCCGVASQRLGVHDHPSIVWDEFVGMWLTLLFAPAGWWWIVAGFVLFRIFDILKPIPIRQLDAKVTGGFGIMLDDIIAGVYAWVCLQLLVWVLG